MADAMYDDRVRRRFNAQPFEVMDEYGLSPEARGALLTVDFTKIGAYIATEVAEWEFPPWDLPETDPECMAVVAEYPNPRAQVFKISPTSSAKAAKMVEVAVLGEGFSRDVALSLVGADGTVVEATELEVSGTYRCSHLKAIVDLTTASIQSYTVKVVNSPGDANEAELPTSGGNPIPFTVV
jgi:hypothetical protein